MAAEQQLQQLAEVVAVVEHVCVPCVFIGSQERSEGASSRTRDFVLIARRQRQAGTQAGREKA